MSTFPGFSSDTNKKSTDADSNFLLPPEKILLFGSWNSFPGLNQLSIELPGNRKIIQGRAVVIKSIGSGRESEELKNVHISKILLAKEHWSKILDCACNPELEIIISNKRIVRKDLLKDKIRAAPPFSFPGKLLAILFKRFGYFDGAADKGLIVVSLEQGENDAETLLSILLELAHLNSLPASFLDWIENANLFYNKYA